MSELGRWGLLPMSSNVEDRVPRDPLAAFLGPGLLGDAALRLMPPPGQERQPQIPIGPSPFDAEIDALVRGGPTLPTFATSAPRDHFGDEMMNLNSGAFGHMGGLYPYLMRRR